MRAADLAAERERIASAQTVPRPVVVEIPAERAPSPDVMLREGTADDLPLVYSSWCHSYCGKPKPREGKGQRSAEAREKRDEEPSIWARGQRSAEVHAIRFQDLIAKMVLGRDATTLLVACWPKDPTFVAGWSCSEERHGEAPIIHYFWTRPDFRGNGLAKLLLAPYLERECWYTHVTNHQRMPKKWKHDFLRVFL